MAHAKPSCPSETQMVPTWACSLELPMCTSILIGLSHFTVVAVPSPSVVPVRGKDRICSDQAVQSRQTISPESSPGRGPLVDLTAVVT